MLNYLKSYSLQLILLVLPTISSYAQTDYVIKGSVTESVTQKPLDYITVSLKNADKPIKSILTKNDGSFTFQQISGGKYTITIIALGYQSKIVQVDLTAENKLVDIGKIAIVAQEKQLNEVVIVADKPLIKQEVDRIGYDVQSDPDSKSQTVIEMLQKVPLVSVDGDDNIQVKGSTKFKVLINGRPSSLIARSPKDVFKSMPASSIQKIEVITTPPAKYDSEGLAGILNIITNKKIDNGYNGGVGLGLNYPHGPGTFFNFTLKEGQFGLNASGGLNFLLTPETTSGLHRQSIGSVPTELIQSGDNRRNGTLNYQSAEFSYEIDSLNLITASVGYNKNALNIENQLFSALYNGDNSLNQSYHLDNTGNDDHSGYDLGLDYQLGFKKNKEQLLTASYKTTNSKNNRDNLLLNTERINYSETVFPDLKQINASGTKEHTVQLDYTYPFKWINIEGGIKGIFRSNFSDYNQLNQNTLSGEFEIDNNQTNKFDYQQNVFGIYNSYQVKLKNWGIKAGMRLERTTVNADFISTSTQVKQGYNNFIPSVSIQRKFKNFGSLNMGYTQRIERPGIQQLNPFINQSNRQSISYGNPDLRSVLNHNFELTYSNFKKTTVNVSVNYSFANRTMENVITLGEDNISRQTWANLGKDKKLGFNMNLSIPVTDKLTIRANGRISHIWIEGAYRGRLYKNDGVQGNLSSTVIYRFNQGFRATVNGGYHGPAVLLQGVSNGTYYSIFAINKEFLNKKANLSLAVNNPFNQFRKRENELNTTTFIQTSYSNSFFRSVNMNFNYRFGRLKEAIKKNKRGINNDDVKVQN